MGRLIVALTLTMAAFASLTACTPQGQTQDDLQDPELRAVLDAFPETFIPQDAACTEFFLRAFEVEDADANPSLECSAASSSPASMSLEMEIEGTQLTVITWCDGVIEEDLHYEATIDPNGTPTSVNAPVICSSDGTRGITELSFSDDQMGSTVVVKRGRTQRGIASAMIWTHSK